MSTTMPMQIQTQATEELRRTRSLRRHRSQNQKNQVQAQGRSTRITTRKNTRSTRPTWRTSMSTTRLTRLSQLHQCMMDSSPKIRTTGEVETGLFAQEEICKPASTFARVSLDQRSMELVFSLVEGDVHDLRLTLHRSMYHHPSIAIKVKCWWNSFQFQTLADLG